MIYEKMINFGFIKDEGFLILNEAFKNNAILKEIHIDIYPEHPLASSTSFMLLLRSITNNAIVLNNGDRIAFTKNDEYVMNILVSKINECYYKMYGNLYEFIFNIQNIHYHVNVLIK